ncbi:MAG: hypothetical protein KBD65_01535 [Candidatus Moranbacteria bacterium]|nr:hypothetical protein [Candidatus Moranbacteria bacterium]
MKTFFRNLSAVALMAFASATTWSAPLDNVAGYDPKDAGGWLQLSFSDVGSDGSYTVTTSGQIGISFVDLGMPDLFIDKMTDPVTKAPVWRYRIPDGSAVHPMPLGSKWGDRPTDPTQIDVNKVQINGHMVSGQVKNGQATLKFTRADKEMARPVNFVIRYPNGKQSWGSLPGQTPADSDYVAVTLENRPMAVWGFNGNKIGPAPRDTITALATKH